MIQNVLDLLKHVNGETETIRIAQGKYYLPDNFFEAFKTINKEIQWHNKKQ